MKINLEKLPKSRVKLSIEVPKEKMEKYSDLAYKKFASSVGIKGFRPGKAPKSMVIEAVGVGRFQEEILNSAIFETYYDAVKEQEINPIHQPAISIKDFKEGNNFIYIAEVDIMPEVKLGDYNNIKLPTSLKLRGTSKTKNEASKEEIDSLIKKLRYQAASFNSIDREAKNGDRVEIDFEGDIDGVKQENLVSKNYPLILGEKVLLPGFEEKLVGLKKEEEREFDLEVPSLGEKDKKKKAHFKIKVIDVKEVILPEVNEEFAKKFGHTNVSNLEKAISGSIVAEKDQRDRQRLEEEILKKISSITQIDLPDSLIEQEISRRIIDIQNQFGQNFPQFLEKSKKTLEDLRKEFKPSAEQTVKIGLLLGGIAKAEKITPDGDLKDVKSQREFTKKILDRLVEITTKSN